MSILVITVSTNPLSLQQLDLQNVFAQDDESQTGLEQSLGQKNLGSGESINFNCADNTLEGSPSSLSLCQTTEEETPEEEPPQEEELLVVCKEVNDPNQEVVPFDIRFIVSSEIPNTIQFQGGPPGDPGPSCSSPFGPGEVVGEYSITEDTVGSTAPLPDTVEVEGDCVQDPTNPLRATGVIQEGETQTCTFINTYEPEG